MEEYKRGYNACNRKWGEEITDKINELQQQYRDYLEKWESAGMNKEHPFYKYIIRIEAEIDILQELLIKKGE